MKCLKIYFAYLTLLIFPLLGHATIQLVAAENVYASIAKQLGGEHIQVKSILNNPTQDPHLFSASPNVAKMLAEASIVVMNGANYDPWINNLLSVGSKKSQITVDIGKLAHVKEGANPHLWYDPHIISLYAIQLKNLLIQYDPQNKTYYQKQFETFNQTNEKLLNRINKLKEKTNGISVTATEPVFGYMADLLGFSMLGLPVQWSIMNDSSPSPKQMKEYEELFTQHKIKILFYNQQVISPFTLHIQSLANKNNIPTVGVSETQPLSFKTYHEWMNATLDQIETKLS